MIPQVSLLPNYNSFAFWVVEVNFPRVHGHGHHVRDPHGGRHGRAHHDLRDGGDHRYHHRLVGFENQHLDSGLSKHMLSIWPIWAIAIKTLIFP